MADLIGFTSISLLFLFTLLLAKRFPSISNILFIALISRVLLIIFGHYVTPLPDSTADARTFHFTAVYMSNEGFSYVISRFEGPSPLFISWVLAIPYSLFGKSILMAQTISLLFGIGSIILGWKIACEIWNDKVGRKVAWTIALFPSLALYSVLVLRETYMVFFLLLALYGITLWVKTNSFKSILIAIFGFTSATFFHGAMIVGGIIFATIVAIKNCIRFFKSLKNLYVDYKSLILIILYVSFIGLYLTNKIRVPYLGTFKQSTDIINLQNRTDVATRGIASWPEWTTINSPLEMIYKAPVRSVYLAYAPFPWDVNKIRHLIGMLDGILYMYLSFLILINIKLIWKDPLMRIFLLILLAYIFVFGIGVGNFGTGIRHRSKFVVVFILLAAPFLKNFVFKKTKT